MNPILGNRLRLIGAGLLVATFFAGAVAGVALQQTVLADETPQGQTLQPTRPDERDGTPRRDPYEGLGLTVDQRAQLNDVFARKKIQIQAFWKEHGPAMKEIRDSARVEVDRILTPEQRSILDERRDARRAHERAREQQPGKNGARDEQHKDGSKGWHDDELF